MSAHHSGVFWFGGFDIDTYWTEVTLIYSSVTSQPLVHLQMLSWPIVSAVNDEYGFLHACVCVPDSEKDDGEPGNGIAQWRLNEQLFPCPVCGKVFGRQQTLSRHLSLHTGE